MVSMFYELSNLQVQHDELVVTLAFFKIYVGGHNPKLVVYVSVMWMILFRIANVVITLWY